MTTDITKLTNEFEGREITTLTYCGKPAWIAREIGEAIGYSSKTVQIEVSADTTIGGIEVN